MEQGNKIEIRGLSKSFQIGRAQRFTALDDILWATGFRAELGHLDPLYLRNDRGGIALRGTRVRGEPRVHLIGFGPSQSTVGANRAGRAAIADLVRYLDRGADEEDLAV